MTLERLHCFLVLAEEMNFTKAAERLYMGQPSLSRTIKALETELGVLLLKRTTRAVSLTEAGKSLLENGRLVETAISEMFFQVQKAAEAPPKKIRILSINIYFPSLFDRIQEIAASNGIDVVVEHASADSAAERIMHRDADMGIVLSLDLKNDYKSLEVLSVFEGQFCVYIPNGHLLGQTERLTLADLRNEDILVLGYNKYNFLQKVLMSNGVEQGQIHPVKSTADMEMQLSLDQKKIAILPDKIAFSGTQCSTHLLTDTVCHYQIFMFWRKDSDNAALRQLVKELISRQ